MRIVSWLGKVDHLVSSLGVSSSCIGGFRGTLILRALAPLAFILLMIAVSVLYHCLRARTTDRRRTRASFHTPKEQPSLLNAAQDGIFAAVPSALVLTFTLAAGVSASIFQARSCESYGYDDRTLEKRYFLREDLSVRCFDDDDEYRQIMQLMWGLVVVR